VAEQLGLALSVPAVVNLTFSILAEKTTQQLLIADKGVFSGNGPKRDPLQQEHVAEPCSGLFRFSYSKDLNVQTAPDIDARVREPNVLMKALIEQIIHPRE
jgi:hypothetical protein